MRSHGAREAPPPGLVPVEEAWRPGVSSVMPDRMLHLLETTAAEPPCGPALDWYEDEDLIWLAGQIDRTSGAPPLPVDWADIQERATKLLARSKDWVLFCLVARSLAHREGTTGIGAGIELLRLAAEKFWPDMHPKLALPHDAGRARRANYLTWVVQGIADALASGLIPVGQATESNTVQEQLDRLDALIRPMVPEKTYAGAERLRKALESSPKVKFAPSGPETDAHPGGLEFPPPIVSAEAAEAVVVKIRAGLFATADFLQKEDGADPKAFRLRRLAAWLDFDRAPALEKGKLLVRGPEVELCARLRSALESDPRGVLQEAEAALQSYPLWIDANHLSFLALRRSGAARAAACDSIRDETLAFVRRMPGLLDLAFADEVPLADPDTRSWLEAELAKVGGTPRGEVTSSAAVEQDGLAQAERAAREAVARGELDQSFEIFGHGIRENAAGRERFRWRLAAARHAGRNGRPDLALDLLEGLDREARDMGLERWEPELCAEVLLAALGVGNKVRGRREKVSSDVLERFPDIQKRLASIDLIAAVGLAWDRPMTDR